MTLRFQFVRTTTRTKFESCRASASGRAHQRSRHVASVSGVAVGSTRPHRPRHDEGSGRGQPAPDRGRRRNHGIDAYSRTSTAVQQSDDSSNEGAQPARGTCPVRDPANDIGSLQCPATVLSRRPILVCMNPSSRSPCADWFQVHERHVELRPGELSVELSVQMQDGLAEQGQSGDPRLRRRKGVHPKKKGPTHVSAAFASRHKSPDRFRRERDPGLDHADGKLRRGIEGSRYLAGVLRDVGDCRSAVQLLCTYQQPNLTVTERLHVATALLEPSPATAAHPEKMFRSDRLQCEIDRREAPSRQLGQHVVQIETGGSLDAPGSSSAVGLRRRGKNSMARCQSDSRKWSGRLNRAGVRRPALGDGPRARAGAAQERSRVGRVPTSTAHRVPTSPLIASPVRRSKKWSACRRTDTSTTSPSRMRVCGLKRPTSAAACGCTPDASWSSTRSSPTSSASSRISSVTACRASTVKWTSTSAPSASRSSTRPLIRGSVFPSPSAWPARSDAGWVE